MIEDAELLRRYTEGGQEEAFGELVRRHIDLVYSAALRVVAGDGHLAEDVSQIVFTELARKARTFSSEVMLAGWLYRTACFTAAKAVRSERRRQAREEMATQMTALDGNTEPTWEEIGPRLDQALNKLSPADRDVIVLRFLKRQDFRSVGAAFNITEEAAQKRVARALEKLRGILSPAHAPLTVAGLGTLLSAQAVTAAPITLAATITAGSLSSIAAGSGATLTTMKIMALINTKTAVVGLVIVGSVGTPLVLQQRALSEVRQENVALRQQVDQLADRQTEEKPAVAPSPIDNDELDRLRKDNVELLSLRNEVRQLREQVVVLRSTSPAAIYHELPTQAVAIAKDTNAVKEAMRLLGVAASRGDFSALDKLGQFATEAIKGRTNVQQYTLGEVQAAFDVLGAEAGAGNEIAFEALRRAAAMRKSHLEGLAVRALGEAADKGNEKALAMLLDPDRYLLTRSTTEFALKPLAQNGNARAIEALAAVAKNERRTAMWLMVAESLENAASTGNPTAIEALGLIAKAQNEQTRQTALRALQEAALKQQPQAAETLRRLGYE